MDYSREQLAERLAAEYVLGTLHGGARRRFETLLPAHPRLRQARLDWERRLLQLDDAIQPVTPSPRVWAGIEQRLFGETRAMVRWWQKLVLWQGAAGLATAAALTLGVLLSQPAPVQPPIVVVMAAQPAAAAPGVQPASFVASVSGDGRSLVLKPLTEGQQVALNKALELWAVPAQGTPRSLGLVSAERATTVLRTQLLKDTAAFAVSVEPPGGSPTGAPTGPIVSVGQLQL
ncbi:anti-sigma factor [uncultured Aquabacterium sp.]|uniref:anti-sigma factor n=1 Tax=Aquabacterium sp. TaxID=1872578 RepID=UPI0025F92F13|nr:anti-sigma factor [uncultured Aquabacterium sp.]